MQAGPAAAKLPSGPARGGAVTSMRKAGHGGTLRIVTTTTIGSAAGTRAISRATTIHERRWHVDCKQAQQPLWRRPRAVATFLPVILGAYFCNSGDQRPGFPARREPVLPVPEVPYEQD